MWRTVKRRKVYNEYSRMYKSAIVNEVDSLVAKGNYNQDVAKINFVLKILNKNTTLSTKLGEAEESSPVFLSTLTSVNVG